MDTNDDHRTAARRRTLKGATIAFHNRSATLPCTVKNMSDTGALIHCVPGGGLVPPDNFHLIVDLDGIDVPCHVVWRRRDLMGVRFEGPLSRTAPKRLQVVSVVVPERPLRLRKTPQHAATLPPHTS